MCFPKSISKNNLSFQFSSFILILLTIFFLGCSLTKIHQEIAPSSTALQGKTAIYVDQFEGKHSLLFKKILNHEIDKHKVFENLKIFPKDSNTNSALLSTNVTRYFVKDIEKILTQKKMILVENKVLHKKFPSKKYSY